MTGQPRDPTTGRWAPNPVAASKGGGDWRNVDPADVKVATRAAEKPKRGTSEARPRKDAGKGRVSKRDRAKRAAATTAHAAGRAGRGLDKAADRGAKRGIGAAWSWVKSAVRSAF